MGSVNPGQGILECVKKANRGDQRVHGSEVFSHGLQAPSVPVPTSIKDGLEARSQTNPFLSELVLVRVLSEPWKADVDSVCVS